MPDTPPIKRQEFLRPLSRDHHFGLLLCWKIRTGLRRSIEPSRIMRYVVWFFATYLSEHFAAEEKYLYPVLEGDNPDVRKALEEHRSIENLLNSGAEPAHVLPQIAEALENHIRYEERCLFNRIQEKASTAQISLIVSSIDNTPFTEHEDRFWE